METQQDDFCYYLSTRLEFESLCLRIIHDGRDPLFVSHGMMERWKKLIREYEFLWLSRC